jgi:cardiolipin synthase
VTRPDWLTLPNAITLGRLGMVPLFLAAHLTHRPALALGIYVLAGASDLVDGLLARILNQRSKLGAMLDPIADKVLVFSALTSLVIEGGLPLWLWLAIAFRDGCMILGAIVVRSKNLDIPAEPTRAGKYATFASVIVIVLALLSQSRPGDTTLEAYTAVVGLLAGECVLLSTLQYFARFGYLFFAPARPRDS